MSNWKIITVFALIAAIFSAAFTVAVIFWDRSPTVPSANPAVNRLEKETFASEAALRKAERDVAEAEAALLAMKKASEAARRTAERDKAELEAARLANQKAAAETARLKAEGDKATAEQDEGKVSKPWGIGIIAAVVAAIAGVAGALFTLVTLLFHFSFNRKLEKLLGPKGVTALSEPSTAREWIMKGLELYDHKKGDFIPPDEAISCFSKAIEVDGNNALAYALRARATLSKFDLEGEKNKQLLSLATQDVSSAIRIDADQPFAYLAKGNLNSKAQQFKKAISSFDEAIRLDPNYAAAYSNRGGANRDLKEFSAAIQDYDRAIQLDPNLAICYNNRGIVYHDLKQHRRAIEDFDKAIRLDPNYARAYGNRGVSQENAGNLTAACVSWRKACELGDERSCGWVKTQC